MYTSIILRQANQALIVQFAELQNLRSRVLEAEQRLLGIRRRANRQGRYRRIRKRGLSR
jgi:hypothetical protein